MDCASLLEPVPIEVCLSGVLLSGSGHGRDGDFPAHQHPVDDVWYRHIRLAGGFLAVAWQFRQQFKICFVDVSSEYSDLGVLR